MVDNNSNLKHSVKPRSFKVSDTHLHDRTIRRRAQRIWRTAGRREDRGCRLQAAPASLCPTVHEPTSPSSAASALYNRHRLVYTNWNYYHYTRLTASFSGQPGVLGCNGISWTICKQSAPHSRQITTPTPCHSIFYRLDALPGAQPTVSKHWKHKHHKYKLEIVRYLTFLFQSQSCKGSVNQQTQTPTAHYPTKCLKWFIRGIAIS